MIKIDFHIHTLPAEYETQFDFDMDTIKEYVTKAELDAIAITNHNKFDLGQYRQIDYAVPATVYPGIEIDLENGHLLLIADIDDADDFAEKCDLVEQKIRTANDSLTLAEFNDIFPNLGSYILIPHYKKAPVIPDDVIQQLGQRIKAGEVTSPKKFMHCIKDEAGLVPVYFSDSRMSDELESIPVRQTYLGCDDARSFSEIKNCFNDKSKVTLSRNEGNELFPIFNNGQMISTGLSVVLGKRSSGKSHTLDEINQKQHEFGKIKYIKQFSLVTPDTEADKRNFDRMLQRDGSLPSQYYLKPLNAVISDVININLDEDDRNISNYVNSLVKYAKESERHDIYSSVRIFGEENFDVFNNKELKKLVSATKTLVSNKDFLHIIENHVSIDVLKKLYIELMKEYLKREQEIRKKNWLNELINEIRGQLKTKTAATVTENIDFYNIVLNKKKIAKFEEVVKLAKLDRVIERKSFYGFDVIAKSVRFNGAGELKDISKIISAFGAAYEKYENPYEYLQELKNITNLTPAEFHKFFIKIEYELLNAQGFKASGGERAEFNLLQEIEDAQKYDMLLIDEPESSFDNLFLKGGVSTIIKDIAKTMPVVVVTHNNTVGASIKPDYILYTQKEIEDGKPFYRVYSGNPASKTLLSTDGKCINTRDITMNCLEAGEEAYNERGVMYENLKN